MLNFLNRQDGVAMLMVIAFMALSIPLITGSLAFASTLSRDSTVKTEILKRQYAALGGAQLGDYLAGGEEGCTAFVLNDVPVNICIGDPPLEASEPPPADNSRRLFTSITYDGTTPVYPASSGPPDPVAVPYPYTITVTDRDDEPENITKIHAMLPPGFAYPEDPPFPPTLVYPGGSTTLNDPNIQGQKLTWNLAPLSITLLPGEYVQLSFEAEAILYSGNYCAEAWADPGQMKTGTGLDALISVWAEAPPNDLCTGAALSLDKSVVVQPGTFVGSNPFDSTYTITLENRGTLPLNVSQVRDLLSPGFTYESGSSMGLLLDTEPTATMFQGQQRLDWDFDPALVIPSGDTWTGTFTAQGPFAGGHWNEAWLTLDEFGDTQYTWPTAGIEILSAQTIEIGTIGESTISSLQWHIGPDTWESGNPKTLIVWYLISS